MSQRFFPLSHRDADQGLSRGRPARVRDCRSVSIVRNATAFLQGQSHYTFRVLSDCQIAKCRGDM
jgi:hypothetical protein